MNNLNKIIENWSQAVNYVRLTGLNYVHPLCTIETANGSKSISIATTGKFIKLTPDEAITYLNEHFEF